MEKRYDVIVIGSGVAGQSAALTCAKAGTRVAVVENRAFGGTCPLRGCDPKKVLVDVADHFVLHRRLRGCGIDGEARINWRDLIAFKRTFTDPVPADTERILRKNHIDPILGRACFDAPDALRIDGERVEVAHIVIAAGMKPRPLALDGVEHVITSDDFLDLERLPKHVVFLGGGYISLEFAHVAEAAGAKVTVLEHSNRPLQPFDAQMVGMLMKSYDDAGIRIRCDAQATRIEKRGEAFRIMLQGGDTLDADLIVHGAGRVPNLGGLELERGEVELDGDDGAPRITEYLQSVSNERVHFAGDASGKAQPLTPVAHEQGKIAAKHLLGEDVAPLDPNLMPSVVFSRPALAMVGQTEETARKAKLSFDVHVHEAGDWKAMRRWREPHAAFKTLVERKSGRILGAHALTPRAEEIVCFYAMAMRHELTADDVRSTVTTYPAVASALASTLA